MIQKSIAMEKDGNLINRMFSSIKTFLINLVDVKKSIIAFSITLFGSVCLLFSGVSSNNTLLFKSASYVANLVETNEKVNHIAVVAEQKEDGIVPDTATELRGLYGAFGNRESNYAGTINAAKDRDLTFLDFDLENRLTFVYVQTGVQVSEKKEDDGKTHYRMEFYPLELMFEFYPNSPTSFYSFLYLSTSQARKVVDYRFPGLFNKDTPLEELLNNESFISKCKEIIGTGISIRFNDEIEIYQITNIFYEKDYFYNIVHETLGEFLVGYNQYPTGFQKQATYFLNKYEYQNKFYLNYIKEYYGKKNCLFDVTSLGLSTINKSAVLDCLQESNNFVSVLLFTISIISILFATFMMFRFELFNVTYAFYSIVSLFIPYLFGLLLWKIVKNVAFFSPFFTVSFLIYMLVISLFYICFYLFEKWRKKGV